MPTRFNKLNPFFYISIFSLVFSCNKESSVTETTNPSSDVPNILFIIADDLGKDVLNGFSEGTIKANTPNIDAIRNAGLSFNNFWTYPTCSPTRASILTGKYGYHTNVKWAGDELSLSETSVQQYIGEQTNNLYKSALIGKWHLSGNNTAINPETFGIDYYAGVIKGGVQSYYNWQLTADGQSQFETEYSTKKFTDLAIDWILQEDKPWFMWLAYNAPHTPFHVPPSEMHTQGDLPEYVNGMNETPYYIAAIEAMDFQIGRLLAEIPQEQKENMIIIFIGDNGTPNQVAQEPYFSTTAKGTLYQGGINVPMFISGHGVSRTGDDDTLISSTDLFATISELAGVTVSEIHDSKSFKPLFTESTALRNYQYSEKDDGTVMNWTISNGTFKLIEFDSGNQEYYNLSTDPYEQNNLLDGSLTTDEVNGKIELQLELEAIRQ